jgi:hypothetical protein
VKPRAYVRFGGGSAARPASFGTENPTLASSEAACHAVRFGNNGDPATFWQVATPARNSWWQVDLERVVLVTGVQTQSTATAAMRRDMVRSPVIGRFVRVTFTSPPPGKLAALSEPEIFGALVTQ